MILTSVSSDPICSSGGRWRLWASGSLVAIVYVGVWLKMSNIRLAAEPREEHRPHLTNTSLLGRSLNIVGYEDRFRNTGKNWGRSSTTLKAVSEIAECWWFSVHG